MKFAVGIIVFFWVMSGLIGAWRMDKLDADHWKLILRGPLTLGEAFSDHPVTYPGP